MPASTGDSRAAVGGQPFTPATFNLVRIALLSGVLLIGGIFWYLSYSGQVAPMLTPETAQLLRFAFYGLLLIGAVGIVLLRSRLQDAETPGQRFQRAVIGYALAEATALFGAVYLLMTGTAMLFLIGLLLFLIAFLLLPAEG